MTRLSWGDPGKRYYETGIDQGVLFVGSAPGVAWSGLISVTESPTGGDARPFYLDGVKYLNISSAEEFAATISAFYAPAEFAPCDGIAYVQNGLSATQQPRRPFSLSYRTRIGNDVDADRHAYKIHIVYNALAAPSQRNRKSLGADADADPFEWSITTLPPLVATPYKATAHLIVDSRTADPTKLTTFENKIYGDVSNNPVLPTPAELIAIFT
jgi:hypothetical protein